MVDYFMSFLSLSTWYFFCWTTRGFYSEENTLRKFIQTSYIKHFCNFLNFLLDKGRFQIKKQKKVGNFPKPGGGGQPNSLPILFMIL